MHRPLSAAQPAATVGAPGVAVTPAVASDVAADADSAICAICSAIAGALSCVTASLAITAEPFPAYGGGPLYDCGDADGIWHCGRLHTLCEQQLTIAAYTLLTYPLTYPHTHSPAHCHLHVHACR